MSLKIELLRNMRIGKRVYHKGTYIGERAKVFIPELEAGSRFVVELEPAPQPAEVEVINHDLSKSGVANSGASEVVAPEASAKKRATRKRATRKRTTKRA